MSLEDKKKTKLTLKTHFDLEDIESHSNMLEECSVERQRLRFTLHPLTQHQNDAEQLMPETFYKEKREVDTQKSSKSLECKIYIW